MVTSFQETTEFRKRRSHFQNISRKFESVFQKFGHSSIPIRARQSNITSKIPSKLAPILITKLKMGSGFLVCSPALSLVPLLDSTNQLLLVREPSLGIDNFAYTHKDLVSSVMEEIRVLWNAYAIEPDESLAEDAKILKQNLLSRFKLEKHA